MARFTFAAAAGLLAGLATAQDPIPIPAVTGASGNQQCGGCYVVADVAGIAFGTETVTAVQTNSVIVVSGFNSTFTTTSVVFDEGQFTFNNGGLITATGGGQSAINTGGSTLVVNGVTLTSPTAYNVFTAYSLTSTVFTNGACQVIAGPAQTLPTAFTVPIPQGQDPAQFALQAENSFVAFVAPPTCSAGGENFGQTTHLPAVVSTTAVTVTSKMSLTPQPEVISTNGVAATTVAGPTAVNTTIVSTSKITIAPSTFLPNSPLQSAKNFTTLPNGTGSFTIPFVGTRTIASGGADRLDSVVVAWGSGLAALFMGVAAYL